MKKNTLKIILSIIEILALVLFIITFGVAFEKSIEVALNSWTSAWIDTKEVVFTNQDKLMITINNITTYVFLIILVIRFILMDKKARIAIGIGVLSILLAIGFLLMNSNIKFIISIIFLVIALGCYLYSHKISFKDKTKIKDMFKKKKK